MKKQKSNCSRRGFIQKTASGAAGLMALPLARKAHSETAAPQEKSRVVVVRHDNAWDSTTKFNQSVALIMMNAGITALTGGSDVSEAWKSLFPGISQSSIIGIKINCLFPLMSTHPPVANALIESLKRMTIEGVPFPENNIILWDNISSNMRAAGFKINTSNTGARCFGTDNNNDSTSYKIDGGANQRLSKIITEQINYLINFSVLKDHWTSGVSMSMKNHYGSIDNVDGSGMHDNYAELPISSINALKPIRDKQVVCICDAIRACTNGGPSASPTETPKSFIFSKDPVAHDYTGAQMLKSFGCAANKTSLTGMAKHIAAAANRYSLGTYDPNQIEKIEINNPVEIPSGVDSDKRIISGPEGYALHQNYPNPFNGVTFINYELPDHSRVMIKIVNAKGQIVRQILDVRQGPGWFQTAWDGKKEDGSQAPSGVYLCVLDAEKIRRSIKMQLIQ